MKYNLMSKKDKSVFEVALDRMRRCESAYQYERLQCVSDRRFNSVLGGQWEGQFYQQFQNKPMIEINKSRLSVKRIINEYRNNRLSVKFLPKPEEMEHQGFADRLASLFRSDEQDSCAQESYDNAFDEAVSGGFGALRLRNVYEDEYDEENQYQRIRIEPIFDADISVFFDPNSQRYDKSDAKWCFVVKAITREVFEEMYGDDPTTWDRPAENFRVFEFTDMNTVNIAEYYVIEEVKEKRFIYRSLDGEEKTFTEEEVDRDRQFIESTGHTFERERTVKKKRVHKYILCGDRILEDLGYIAGKHIPIVPWYGERFYIDGIERCISHTRFSKDAQRVKNMLVSKLAEISSLSTVAKPIFVPEQIAGHEGIWQQDNVENYAYLTINPVTDSTGNSVPQPPVAYTQPPSIPDAIVGLMQATDMDMKEILGNNEAAEKVTSNISGLAVGQIMNSIAMQSYIYISNAGKSIQRVGEIWLSMAQDVYVEKGRRMKGVSITEESDVIELLKPVQNPETGEIEYENDLSKAKMDVSIEIGPSTASRRASVVQTLIGVLPLVQDPVTQKVVTSMIMMNMEGEGIEDVRRYFRQDLLRQGVVQPTEKEAQQLQQEAEAQQPTPNDQFLLSAAKKEASLAEKAKTDAALNMARVKETNAKAVEILANLNKPNA